MAAAAATSAVPTGAASSAERVVSLADLKLYAEILSKKNFLAFVATWTNFNVGLTFTKDQFAAFWTSLNPAQRTLLEPYRPTLENGHVLLVFITPFLFATGFNPKQVADKIAMIKNVCAMIGKVTSITLLGLLLNGKAGDHVRVGLNAETMPLSQNAEPHFTIRVEPGFDVVKFLSLELAKYGLPTDPAATLPGTYTPLGLSCEVTVTVCAPSLDDTPSMVALRTLGKEILDAGREVTSSDIALMSLLAAKADHEVKSAKLDAAITAQSGASGPAKKAADKAAAAATSAVEKAKDLVATKQAAYDALADPSTGGGASASPAPTGAAVGGAGGPSSADASSSSSAAVAAVSRGPLIDGTCPPSKADCSPSKADCPPPKAVCSPSKADCPLPAAAPTDDLTAAVAAFGNMSVGRAGSSSSSAEEEPVGRAASCAPTGRAPSCAPTGRAPSSAPAAVSGRAASCIPE